MAKNNNYIARQQAKHAMEIKLHRNFTMRWCADAAILAANDVFQRRGDKLAEFMDAFFKYSKDIATMTLSDAKDDKTLEYTKAKVDARLQELLGDAFQPWDERYDFGRLMED